jgi:dihydrofolate reductase
MINCIVAVEKSQGIGYQNSLPWPRIPGDMNWFKKMTTNNVIIMGSNTYKSLGKPLPNRINVVLSKTHDYSGLNQADHTFSDPDNALTFCQVEYPDKEIFIIGGEKIYNFYLPKIDRFFITEIDHDYICDTYFNLDYVRKNFTAVKEHAKFPDPIPYTIKEYTK